MKRQVKGMNCGVAKYLEDAQSTRGGREEMLAKISARPTLKSNGNHNKKMLKRPCFGKVYGDFNLYKKVQYGDIFGDACASPVRSSEVYSCVFYRLQYQVTVTETLVTVYILFTVK